MTWKTERGLSNNSIIAIAQDRAGYLWLGTPNGLVQFDGVNFKNFNKENTVEFRDDFINNVVVDRRGILWIGSYGGHLLSLNDGKFTGHFLSDKLSGISNHCLVGDVRGNIWVGTSQGLFCRPDIHEGLFREVPEFAGKKIYCLWEDRSGVFWVATKNSVWFRRNLGQWQQVLADSDIRGYEINVLYQDRGSRLWIGTDNGVFGYQNGKIVYYSLGQGMRNNITSFLEDRDGNLWLASEGGMFRWQNGKFQFLPGIQGQDNNYIYSLYEDFEGSLWVGMIEGGLTQIRDEKITSFTSREGLGGDLIRCLHGAGSDTLWIGGNGGYLSLYKNDRFRNFTFPETLRNNSVWSIEYEGQDALWLGTSLGLIRFQGGSFRKIPVPGSEVDSEVRCVLKDSEGRLWITLWGRGLACRQPNGSFRLYTTRDGLPDNHIACVYEDRRGNLWIGSEGGASMARPDKNGVFRFTNVFLDCQAVSFFEDNRQSMWVGTRNQGLKVQKDGRWGSLNSDRGLFDNRIYAILEDDLGYLWLSSERGIFRARKSDLERAAFDPKQKVRGQLFDENDGMKSRICNNGQPAAWKDGSGRLWFATLAGVVSIDPAHIRKNERVPPVLVEEVLVDNHSLFISGNSRTQPLKLAAGSKRFEFKYTALSFIRSDKIAFKYKLEGYDKEWTSAGNRREAFYNNLRPGRYRFRVRAANADGVWNLAGASFAFYLRPFVYQTWWFLALSALAFMVVSVLLWQLLKKYLRAVTFWKKKTHIGHFKILETIGTGGMATVYKAQDMLDRKRVVALKVLKEENFHDENQKKRFKHESLITAQLDHPHIVRIIERGEMEDCWYIAMELLQGESLALLIRRGGRLAVSAALDIMLQIVDALRAIHAQNIVHRDLKPENIMVSAGHGRQHFVKLLDFGLAITPAQSRLTMSGVVMGTIRYLPPERISDGTSSPAGDIYSAGIILYEMLTGSKPFWSEATGEVIHRILKTYPLPPIEISREVPGELNALIMAMIDKEPARRPALDAITDELRRLAEKFPPQI